jgi:general secretion pathway protein K
MTIGQLFLVKGLKNIEPFGKIQNRRLLNFITIYGDGRINVNTAPLEVLQALDKDIDTFVAQSIIDYRSEKSFSTPSDLARVVGLDAGLLNRITPLITVRGSLFTIELKVTFQDAKAHIRATAKRANGRITLVYYQAI